MNYSNTDESARKKFGRMGVWICVALAMIVVAGCIIKLDNARNNEIQATPKTTDTPVTANTTPSAGPPGPVSKAPHELYIKAGQIYHFKYRENFTVNYISAYPTQIVKISFGGYEKTIQKELSDSPNQISWGDGFFGFTLKPVIWEIRERQRIPLYERTWNTTELYFKVFEVP